MPLMFYGTSYASHFHSTSYTTAAYGSHQNVLLRLDTLGRPPSSTGSYATIASLHKFPFGKFDYLINIKL